MVVEVESYLGTESVPKVLWGVMVSPVFFVCVTFPGNYVLQLLLLQKGMKKAPFFYVFSMRYSGAEPKHYV